MKNTIAHFRCIIFLFLVPFSVLTTSKLSAQNYSFNWQDLQLSWPIRFDPTVSPVYANSDPFLFPSRYTLIKANDTDYKGGTGGHNGIDIGLNFYRTTDNDGAKIYAAAKGVLVAYRDGLADRLNGSVAWDKMTPSNKLTVTDLASSHTGFNIQGTTDGSGNVVYLQHNNGFVTQYAHLKQGLPVLKKYKLGDTIPEGALLGIMASSGASSGPHLHFGVYTGPHSTIQGVVIPASERVFKGYLATPWGYFVCPFYEETIQGKPKNMWKGKYPEAYKPLENGNLDIYDLGIFATPFNLFTPPPNASMIPQGYPVSVVPYVVGAKGDYSVEIKSNATQFSFGAGKDTLKAGTLLSPGEQLPSKNGNFYLTLQSNGQLSVWERGAMLPRWSSTTPPVVLNAQYYARLNPTGRLCVYLKGQAQDTEVWCSDATVGSGSFYAVIQPDGNFCVYKGKNEYRWCTFSQSSDRNLTSFITYLNNLAPGDYTVNVLRRVPGEQTPILRAQSKFTVFQGDAVEKISLSTASDNTVSGQLTAGDFYNGANQTEKQTQFTVYLPAPASTKQVLQFAVISIPITGITGLNPFESTWGATMQLKASVNGKVIAYFSPVTVLNGIAKAVVVNPTDLFNPAAYGLSNWPAAGVPITVSFEVPMNNNKQSDYLRFGAVTLEYYYRMVTSAKDLDKGNIQNLQLFPNPTEEEVQIKFQLAESAWVRVELYDLLGRLQAPGLNQGLAAGAQQIPLRVQQLPVGVYWLQVEAEGSRVVKKLVVKR